MLFIEILKRNLHWGELVSLTPITISTAMSSKNVSLVFMQFLLLNGLNTHRLSNAIVFSRLLNISISPIKTFQGIHLVNYSRQVVLFKDVHILWYSSRHCKQFTLSANILIAAWYNPQLTQPLINSTIWGTLNKSNKLWFFCSDD